MDVNVLKNWDSGVASLLTERSQCPWTKILELVTWPVGLTNAATGYRRAGSVCANDVGFGLVPRSGIGENSQNHAPYCVCGVGSGNQ